MAKTNLPDALKKLVEKTNQLQSIDREKIDTGIREGESDTRRGAKQGH